MRLVWLFVLLTCAMVAAIEEESPRLRTPRAWYADAPQWLREPGSEQAREEHPEREPAESVAQKEIDEIEEDPELPPQDDPVELGDCSLMLHVSDKATQRPIEANVQLWRLDAPGNEHWERGDQLQAHVSVLETGRRLDRLPAGRYRIYSRNQRIKSEDPPEFKIAGYLTTARLELEMPREFSVHVRIYTETGHMLMRAKHTDLGSSTSYESDKYPEWRTKRAPKNGVFSNGWIGWSCGSNRSVAYVASEHGFDLGSYPEDERGSRRTSSHRLASEGRSEVSVHLTRDVQRDRSYIALSVQTEPIVASIVMPDGGLARDAGARIRIWCPAKLEEPGDPAHAWRELPVRVRVLLKGYEPLEFKYRLGDTLPLRTLRRGAAD